MGEAITTGFHGNLVEPNPEPTPQISKWREHWHRFRADLADMPRGFLASFMGVTLAAGLGGGFLIGHEASGNADPGSGHGGVAAGAPPSPTYNQVNPNVSPTPSSGVSHTSEQWTASCTGVSTQQSGTMFTFTPQVSNLPPDTHMRNVYTFLQYGDNQNPDVRQAAQGIHSMQANLDNGLITEVTEGVEYFPDDSHQPNLRDLTDPDGLSMTFPEAQVVMCPQVMRATLGLGG